MNNSSSFYDYKVFLKKNLKIIIFTALAVLVAMMVAAFYFVSSQSVQVIDDDYIENEILPEVNNLDDVDVLSSGDQEVLNDYLNKRSYSFRIYVENEDSSVFTDFELLKKLLLDDELVQTIVEETGSEFLPSRELALSVFRISGSHMLQIKVGTGNEEYNRNISQFYYDYIADGNPEVLEEKNVYFVDSKPIVFEEQHGIVEEEEEVPAQENVTSNLEVFIIVGIMGILGGLIFGTFLSVIKETAIKKIPSIYNFELSDNQKLVNLDAIPAETVEKVDEMVVQSIVADNRDNKLVLSEKSLNPSISESVNAMGAEAGTLYKLNVNNMEDVQFNDIQQVIVLVQIYETSKKWFEKQMEQVKILDVPVKIVRLPAEKKYFNN